MRRFSLAALLSIALTSLPTHAAIEYRASVDVTGIFWNNASELSTGGKVVVGWKDASYLNLPTVTNWVPATFAVTPESAVKFTGMAAGSRWESEDVPVSIVGMQYNNIGIGNSISNSGIGSSCTADKIGTSVIELRGANCVSSSKITNNVSTAPFILYRPILDIKDTDIESALSGMPKGSYTAFTPITVKFHYYVGSALTYYQFTEMVSIVIDYDPVAITSVTLSQKEIDLVPTYNADEKTVSSDNKEVTVAVNGYFDNGIRLNIDNRDYVLTHEKTTNAKIPYYIQCVRCGAGNNAAIELVNKYGKTINASTVIGDSQASTINFSLHFGYEDVDGTTLVSGSYVDVVNLVIEPVI